MADGSRITASDIGIETDQKDAEMLNIRQVREDAEKRIILRVLARVDNNMT
jgi:two-component system NtrC family response regulator